LVINTNCTEVHGQQNIKAEWYSSTCYYSLVTTANSTPQ